MFNAFIENNIFNICIAVYKKNRYTTLRAYPYSFMISRITGGIFAIILPMLLYHYVFNDEVTSSFMGYVGSSNYLTYIVLGQALNVLSFATLMNVGRCLISEIREGTIDNFLLSPASRIGYYLGVYIEQLGRSILEYLVMIAFGWCLGMRIPLDKIFILLVVFIVASFAFFSISITVSTIMVYTRDTYLVQNTIFLLMDCICGVIFPIEYLPKIVQVIADFFPLTVMLKIFRNSILLNSSLYECRFLFLQLLILSIFYISFGYFGFKRMEKRLIEEVFA